MSRRPILLLAALVLCSAAAAQIALDTNRLGYTGSVTRYATIDDAIAGANALGSYSVPQRDLAIMILSDAPWLYSGYTNCNYIGTAWNFISATEGRTPSNTNFGFIQLGDLDGSTDTALTAAWNPSRDTFTLHLSGTNAVRQDDYARLWNAGGATGPASITAGNFVSYEFKLEAVGLSAVWDADKGTYIAPNFDPAAVSGYFRGVFQNLSPDDGQAYTFDLALNLDSWAYAHRGDLAANSDPYVSSTFAATSIPEPATTALLLGLGAGGLVGWRRRRR